MIQVSALKWSPPFAQGEVRDLRVRWALEEAGLSYEEMLVDADDQESEAYRAMQPFGQVPIFEQDGLVLFETSAILLHVASRSGGLMPSDADAQARVTSWLFAAFNSIEPFITNVVLADIFHEGEDWAKQWRPSAVEMAEDQPKKLAVWLDGREWLEADRFTVADLLMTTVLRIPRHSISSRNMPSSTPICAVASPAPPSSTRWPHRWRCSSATRKKTSTARDTTRRGDRKGDEDVRPTHPPQANLQAGTIRGSPTRAPITVRRATRC